MSFSEEFFDALLDAYTAQEVTRLLKFSMDIDFNRVVAPGSEEERFFSLLDYLERRDRLGEFIDHAQAARPRNAKLAGFAGKVVSTPLSSAPEQADAEYDALQRMVRKRAAFADWGYFLARAQEIAYRICLIQFPVKGGKLSGTGFLVHGDKVLTNCHVVSRLIDGEVEPGDVDIRFDFRTARDGTIVNDGTPVTLHGDGWLLDHSPHAEQDERAGRGDAPLNKLDYALLRLAEAIGEAPIGRDAGGDAPKRSWLTLPEDPINLAVGDDVLLLQHPRGVPLKSTLGRVTAFNGNGSRVRYDANSLKGSSGGAVFDADLTVAALHHAGDPNFQRLAEFNQGVPLHLIVANMVANGIEPFWR